MIVTHPIQKGDVALHKGKLLHGQRSKGALVSADVALGVHPGDEGEDMGESVVVQCNLMEPNRGNHTKLKMGLNLKSQVKFKSVKQAARGAGTNASLSLPLVRETLVMLEPSDDTIGPPSSGPGGDVLVFNHRPPDPNSSMDMGQDVSMGNDMVGACEEPENMVIGSSPDVGLSQPRSL
ncbi:hypothetical protein SESBI_08604 [Sesbania bispinosa]|nr:hypothetical protein SESBI_08604 [Sesbania bispinosa]